jgi:hypothetical protein
VSHQKPIRFKLILEGEINMGATVTGTYTIQTGAGTTPPSNLAITPPAGSDGPNPSGTAITPFTLATISGGTPPYTFVVSGLPSGTGYELNEGPSADGVAGDVDITMSGTPTAADASASPDTLTIVVTDSSSPAASASLKRKLGR